ncbi:MAG: GNAT family N-acetyltransferase, partial [Rhodospirillales bacterium]|nr:GNAT family N-acetyltransferase [Rhodospirillales bacterium]
MDLSYRRMRIDDLPAAFAVRLSTIENAVTMAELERDYGITPRSLSEAMKSHVKGWLCEDSGTVVGFAMGDLSSGEVQVVAVRPEYEGKGIGGNLLMRVQ